MKNRNDNKLTRRQIVQRVALAAAGSALLSKPSMSKIEKNDDPPCCGAQTLPTDSVFTKVCNGESATKYHSGDNPVVYKLGAMWLMLATENWTKYFRDPKNQAREDAFLQGLSDELKLNLQDVQKLWEISKTKFDSFEDIRGAWQDLTSNQGLYGARPCHGGKSILSIACLDPKDERSAPMLKLK